VHQFKVKREDTKTDRLQEDAFCSGVCRLSQVGRELVILHQDKQEWFKPGVGN